MADKAETDDQSEELVGTVYDLIKDIQDPEKPETLEELAVVYEEGVEVKRINDTDTYYVKIEFTPTVPHCSLATLIGLCLRIKLERDLPQRHKLDILIKEGTHTTGPEINKQINDKERVAAALENPNLKELVYTCINNTPV